MIICYEVYLKINDHQMLLYLTLIVACLRCDYLEWDLYKLLYQIKIDNSP